MTDRFLVRSLRRAPRPRPALRRDWRRRHAVARPRRAHAPRRSVGHRLLATRAWRSPPAPPPTCATARPLVEGDLFDRSHLPEHAFDVVYSGGFVEHFPSPGAVMERFLELAAPAGVVVTLVPNLGGLNGALQALADPDTFARHVVHTPAVARRRARRGRPRPRRARALPRLRRPRLRQPDAHRLGGCRARCGARCRTRCRSRAAPASPSRHAPTPTAAASSRP